MLGLPTGTLIFLFLAIFFLRSINILAENERGAIFRFGRLLPLPVGPGLVLAFRPIDKLIRFDLDSPRGQQIMQAFTRRHETESPEEAALLHNQICSLLAMEPDRKHL